MGSFRVSLLLWCFGVLSARKGAPGGSREEGKGSQNVSILKVHEGGSASLDLQLNITKQIRVWKWDPLTSEEKELFLARLGKLYGQKNESRISLINQTFTVQDAERRDEGLYSIALLNEGTILAVVNVTLSEPPSSSAELPSSTDAPETGYMALAIGLPVAILAAAAAVFFLVQKYMKKRKHKESSSSTSTAKMAVGLLQSLVNRTTAEDNSEPSTGSNTAILSPDQDVPV